MMTADSRLDHNRISLKKAPQKLAGPRFYLLYFLIYTAVWLLFAVLILRLFRDNGKTFLWAADGVYQHFASFQYLCDTLSALFHRSSQALNTIAPLNFTIGQGADILTTLNSYDYTDPISILCALITPLSRLDRYTLMIFIKLWLSGAAFSVYCFLSDRKGRLYILIGALSYTFSGAVLFIFARHPNYVNWAYFLPLLLGGVELYRRRGKALPLIFFVFFNLLTSYYTFYMNAVLTVIYVVVVSVCEILSKRNAETVKKELLTDLRLAGLFVVGAMLSAVVLLPTVYAFLNNPRVGELTGYRESMWTYGGDFVRALAVSACLPGTSAVYYTILGIIPMAVLGIFSIFTQKKKNTELKVLTVLMFVMLCIPIMGRILNGMGYATNRWGYAVVFVCSVVLVEALPLLKQMTGAKKWITAGLSAAYLVFLLICSDLYAGAVKNVTMAALLLCILAFCFVPKKGKYLFKAVMTVLALVIVFVNINLTYLPDIGNDTAQFRSQEDVESLYNAPNVSLKDASTPENFFRVECKNRISNVNGVNHVNGTNSFWSLQPQVLSDFYRDMELAAVVQNCNFKGLDGRTALLELASVKYFAVFKPESHVLPYGYEFCEEYTTDAADVYENTMALPIAYTYDSYITYEEYAALNPVEKQQVLMKSAVLQNDTDALKKVQPDTSDVMPVSYEITELNGVELDSTSMKSLAGGAAIMMKADIPENCEVYLRIGGVKAEYPDDFDVNAVRQNDEEGFYLARSGGFTNPDNTWHVVKDGIVYNLGCGGAGENTVMIEFDTEGLLTYETLELYAVKTENFEEDVRKLSACPFENAYVDSEHISGDITTDKERLLQFSVPYSDGFSVTIDGKKAQVLQSDAMYTAVLVPAGEHHIELRYRTPYLRLGVIVSILTALGLSGFYVIRAIRKRKGSQR